MAEAPFPWQAAAWRRLSEGLASGRLSHAVLISGLPGLGKGELAWQLLAAVLCDAGTDRPCGSCRSCHLFGAGNHPDLHRLEPPEDKTTIQVAQVRALIGDLQLSSHSGGAKAALIEPADVMTEAAANSLLKTLEEPPSATYLVLVTAHPARLPATIRSRCLAVPLSPPPRDDGVRWLADEGGDRDWPVLLEHAGGAPLRALALADEDFEDLDRTLAAQMDALSRGRTDPAEIAQDWLKRDGDRILTWLARWSGDLVRLGTAGQDAGLVNERHRPLLQTLSQGIDLEDTHAYMRRLQRAMRMLSTPVNRQSLYESVLIPWCDALR